MADRRRKLRRLDAFRRSKSHCSASAIAQILSDVKRNGLPELTHRNAMREARNRVAAARGAYGPILQSIDCVDADGASKRIPIACPFASLAAAVEESASFRRLLKRQLQRHPSSPEQLWNIVMYSDEVTPGNPLATLNKQKFQSIFGHSLNSIRLR